MKGYFVTGTGTDVGKTVASAWLVKKLDAYYWKPIQTGLSTTQGDRDTLLALAGIEADRILSTSFAFQAPLSPHVAARLENVTIPFEDIALPDIDKPLIVEGAGGILVPINDDFYIVDLIQKLQLSAIVVTHSGLGTINHTLLTIEALRARDIAIAGVIMNGPLNPLNKESIERYGKVTVIGELPFLEPLTNQTLMSIPLHDTIRP